MKPIIFIMALLSVAWVPPMDADVDALTDYVNDFFGKVRKKDKVKAINEIVPNVVTYSRHYDIDPMLLAIVITFESSWTDGIVSKSEHAEKGLTQVHGLCAKGHNLDTIQGQVQAGAKCLRMKIDRCGDVLEGLNAYQTKGSYCKPIHRRVARRWKTYQKAREVYYD